MMVSDISIQTENNK